MEPIEHKLAKASEALDAEAAAKLADIAREHERKLLHAHYRGMNRDQFVQESCTEEEVALVNKSLEKSKGYAKIPEDSMANPNSIHFVVDRSRILGRESVAYSATSTQEGDPTAK